MGEDCCERVGCDWASPMEVATSQQKVRTFSMTSYDIGNIKYCKKYVSTIFSLLFLICDKLQFFISIFIFYIFIFFIFQFLYFCIFISFFQMEPKVFFANERTFISWLSMAVNLSSISIGVLAFSSRNCTFHRLFKLKLIQFDWNSLALFYHFRYLIAFLIIFDCRF